MRIAYFSPLSPQRSGIAAYSEELLPYLAPHFDIDLFVDGYEPSHPQMARSFAVYDGSDFDRRMVERRYRTALYHMGNSTFHEYVYRALLRWPGVTVLHDLVLHHFVNAVTERRGNPAAFVREMAYGHGPEGRATARRYLRAGTEYAASDYPLSRRVVESSLGVIVHSHYVGQRVQEMAPGVRVGVVPHLAFAQALPTRAEARERLGLAAETFVVASFGMVTHEKRFHVTLPAFRRFLSSQPDALYAVVGEVPDWHPLPQWVADRGLEESVRLPGYVDADTLADYLSAADLCLNLRYPTMGETSGSLLRILGAGLPAVVSDVGWYAELPDDACYKLGVDEGEEDRLLELMGTLAADPAERMRLGERARRYVQEQHAPARVAQAYADFLREIVDR